MDDARRRRLAASMSRFTSLEEVAEAIACLGPQQHARVYVERRGSEYRWSIAHRGGAYPLLREVAVLLDVPHTSLILPFTTIDGWAVVKRESDPESAPDDYAILKIDSRYEAWQLPALIRKRIGSDDARRERLDVKLCQDCKKERPSSDFKTEQTRCISCWKLRYEEAAFTFFGLVNRRVRKVKGGYRVATIVDGEFSDWVCSHKHRSTRTARACADRVKWF